MPASDRERLSVSVIDVRAGQEATFQALMRDYEALVQARGYGRADTFVQEGVPLRFYAVRRWNDAEQAARCHADPDVRAVTSRIYEVARVTHVVNGARPPNPPRLLLADRRTHVESDRRAGFERRVANTGRAAGDRRGVRDRRIGPRRLRSRPGEVDLVDAARRARQHADAAFSKFMVGAALETADGAVITGCNIENATYGLTMCAERVAMFKALSEGHRAFTRIAIVADTSAPTPPCGACRQVLWEFGGNLEIRLANLETESGTHHLRDLLPLPFDARLL